MKIKNHGFKVTIDDITPDQYVFGTLQLETRLAGIPELQLDRNWEACIPEHEIQHNQHFDTNSCYIYGSLNMFETMLSRLTGKRFNFSERFIASLLNHNFIGGNPHDALEVLRKQGSVAEAYLPFNETITRESYVASIDAKMLAEARKVINEWNITHDWLILPNTINKANLIWSQLMFSPVGVSVLAWQKGKKYYTKPKGATDTHWCVIIGGKEGEYFTVLDTYDETIKKLEWDYDFQFAKRMIVQKQTKRDNWIMDLIKRFFNLFK